jgi:hypothetical protein
MCSVAMMSVTSLNAILLSVALLSVALLSVSVLSVILHSVILQSVILRSVILHSVILLSITLHNFAQHIVFCWVSFCKVSFCKVSFCKVSFCKVSFCKVSFCKVSFCKVSFCKVSQLRTFFFHVLGTSPGHFINWSIVLSTNFFITTFAIFFCSGGWMVTLRIASSMVVTMLFTKLPLYSHMRLYLHCIKFYTLYEHPFTQKLIVVKILYIIFFQQYWKLGIQIIRSS